MVTIQEIEEREGELSNVESQARALASQEIPQRRYGAGVTSEQQQKVIQQRQEATKILLEVQAKRSELGEIKSQVLSQQEEVRKAQEKKREFDKGVEIAVKGGSVFALRTREAREGYRAGKSQAKYAQAVEKYNKEVKASEEIKELPSGEFYYKGQLYDVEGKPVLLKSGIGYSFEEATIRQKLIESRFLLEQSSAFRLTAEPLPEVIRERPERGSFNLPSAERGIVSGVTRERKVEELGGREAQIQLAKRKATITTVEALADYFGSFGVQTIESGVERRKADLGYRSEYFKKVKQAELLPEFQATYRRTLIAQAVAPLVALSPRIALSSFTAIKESVRISATRTGYALELKSLTSFKLLGEEIAGGFSVVNPRVNVAKAFQEFKRGIYLRQPIDIAVGQEPSLIRITGGKAEKISNYEAFGELKPERYKISKEAENIFDFIYQEPSRLYKIKPLVPVIDNKPYIQVEFRDNSRVVRLKNIAGRGEAFNPNLDIAKLSKAERYTLLQSIEAEIGRPISLRSGRKTPSDEEIFIKFFKESDEQIFERGQVISEKLTEFNLREKTIKVYGDTGRRTSLQSYTSRTVKILETPKEDIYRSIATFKDIGKPGYRARGKTPQIRLDLIQLKEPVIIDTIPEPIIIQGGKPTPRLGAFRQIQEQISEQLLKTPVPKSLPNVPKVRTTTKAIEPLSSQVAFNPNVGTGQYERSEGFVGRLAPKGFVQQDFTMEVSREFSSQVPFNVEKSVSIPVTKEINKEITKEINKEITKELTKEITKQVPRDITKQINKQLQRQVPKQITKQINKQLQKGIPAPVPPANPFKETPLPPIGFILSGEQIAEEGQQAYRPFVRIGKKGKKVYLGGALPKGFALTKAQLEAEKTLRATFGADPIAQLVRGDDISFKINKELFRDYRIKSGKKIPLKDEFIQKQGKRLASQYERLEIQQARRSK